MDVLKFIFNSINRKEIVKLNFNGFCLKLPSMKNRKYPEEKKIENNTVEGDHIKDQVQKKEFRQRLFLSILGISLTALFTFFQFCYANRLKVNEQKILMCSTVGNNLSNMYYLYDFKLKSIIEMVDFLPLKSQPTDKETMIAMDSVISKFPFIYDKSLEYDKEFPTLNGNLILTQAMFDDKPVYNDIIKIFSIVNVKELMVLIYQARIKENLPKMSDSLKTNIRNYYSTEFETNYRELIKAMGKATF